MAMPLEKSVISVLFSVDGVHTALDFAVAFTEGGPTFSAIAELAADDRLGIRLYVTCQLSADMGCFGARGCGLAGRLRRCSRVPGGRGSLRGLRRSGRGAGRSSGLSRSSGLGRAAGCGLSSLIGRGRFVGSRCGRVVRRSFRSHGLILGSLSGAVL